MIGFPPRVASPPVFVPALLLLKKLPEEESFCTIIICQITHIFYLFLASSKNIDIIS